MKRACLICAALAPIIAALGAETSLQVKADEGGLRNYEMRSKKPLRDNLPADGVMNFKEHATDPRLYSGNDALDVAHALACHEARLNAVDSIRDGAYQEGAPIPLNAYQTGEKWTYVWTRDLAYSCDLGLAAMDPQRAIDSLFFKTSGLKDGLHGGAEKQIVQDTGSGGSWPVSSDRVIWALGLRSTISLLEPTRQKEVAKRALPILLGTLAQDRQVLLDPSDGLYRGEQSFLDWREQTYPASAAQDVGPIAASKSLSTNVAFLIAMETADRLAQFIGEPLQFTAQASELRAAIQREFYDTQAKQYAAILWQDSSNKQRLSRRDLLGTCLAILEGLPSKEQAIEMLSNYPIGPHGPPVVSPQEPGVPIYHNCGIWPFVTSYWVRAAAASGHSAAAAAGIDSILKGITENLSNMENFDFVTGAAMASHNGIEGPEVNSRRQLWSVAGTLGIFHDVLFGRQIRLEGIRFLPKFPAEQLPRFPQRVIQLRNLSYHGKIIDVELELPETAPSGGMLEIEKMSLNGLEIDPQAWQTSAQLSAKNTWIITLKAGSSKPFPLRKVNPLDDFAPKTPRWDGVGVTLQNGKVTVRFSHDQPMQHHFRVFRDGVMIAADLDALTWQDPEPGSAERLHAYAVEAIDQKSKLISHPTPSRRLEIEGRRHTLGIKDAETTGGKIIHESHLSDWGKPEDVATFKAFQPKVDGWHLLQVAFANGHGPINTGISCGIKRLDVLNGANGSVISTHVIVMPQSGDWKRRDLTTPIRMQLDSNISYQFRIRADEWTRNMSALSHNERYTAFPGGGKMANHYVDLYGIELLQLLPD
ncbi:MAG: hypothetical protein EAZ42_02940 [Verrucomicrobia bacterium]|nr:MAG: hypothetical protein EAZ42_02940 [Verrucomicrobiota bacterium]